MPIKKEFRHFYGPEWQAIRAAILARDRYRCSQCRRPNHKKIWVTEGGLWRPYAGDPRWRDSEGKPCPPPIMDGEQKVLVVKLGVAHLNHDPSDNRDENLASLCARCHLIHDQKHHYATGRRTRAARAGQLWIEGVA